MHDGGSQTSGFLHQSENGPWELPALPQLEWNHALGVATELLFEAPPAEQPRDMAPNAERFELAYHGQEVALGAAGSELVDHV